MISHIHHRVRRHTISFAHAMEGVIWALKTQPNYQIHLLLSFIAIFASVYFHIEKFEWLIIVLTIGVGLAIETINSSLEQTLDCVTLERRSDIKIAKDAAAAAMLIYALAALVVALIIFVPYIF